MLDFSINHLRKQFYALLLHVNEVNFLRDKLSSVSLISFRPYLYWIDRNDKRDQRMNSTMGIVRNIYVAHAAQSVSPPKTQRIFFSYLMINSFSILLYLMEQQFHLLIIHFDWKIQKKRKNNN